ncbi:peroxide stress protein YaaA [Capnocytophaga sp. ARDL2]|uniref:peroxide stress protein YaaA n=1 Tax=Capnocytophaga sp. ARDL2 TaxID=3238809 RepID=UPI003557E31E
MKIITSPAKLMSIDKKSDHYKPTQPKFIKEATLIQSYLKEKSPAFLSELMEISDKLANENWQRNQQWKAKPKEDESNQALFSFTGEVYRGLDAHTLSTDALDYLQENYRMLSGLYGLLKPSDIIMPYRLEMGRNFAFETYKNLYEFWQEKLSTQINKETKKGELLLNLASTEYFKATYKKKLHAHVIDFDFQEIKSGKPKTIVVYTKHARGLMVRYCAETNAQTLDDVKAFHYEGYFIDEDRSTDKKLVFVR